MPKYQAEVSNLRYNAARQCFEALVIFHEGADRISFACELAAPISSDFAVISRALVMQAKSRRMRDARGMISRLKAIAPEVSPLFGMAQAA
ncbi:MAG: hypothetical protein ACRBBK_12180 [Paracoccaceae bacterium]